MGMNLDGPLFLQRQGWLTRKKHRVLDIGPQTIYGIRPEQIREFRANQGDPIVEDDDLRAEIERLVYFSTPREGERTTMFSEITDLTNIEYASIDVCPGLKNTEIMDLNFDELPDRMRGLYDVLFNFGTTEHIVNQWNCFEIMHDALKVGGVVYHQLPMSGYLDHGYYCYTPLFFRELANANSYAIERLAVTPAGENRIDALGIPSIGGDTILKEPAPPGENNRLPQFNLHVILRKTESRPFRASLEIATAHSTVNSKMRARYSEFTELQAQLDAVMTSRSWRITAPLRSASSLFNGVISRFTG